MKQDLKILFSFSRNTFTFYQKALAVFLSATLFPEVEI